MNNPALPPMRHTLAALESAGAVASRVSLLMKASAIVLSGCPAQVQQFFRHNEIQKDMQGAFNRFTEDYAGRVTVVIDLGHLASDWLTQARRQLDQAVAQDKESSVPVDQLTQRLHGFARQVLDDLDLAQRTVQQSQQNATASIEMLREAALRADPSAELQATIDALFKRILRPSPGA